MNFKWLTGFIYLILLVSSMQVSAQQMAYNRTMVDTLASTNFWGRGYTKNGMSETADFLEQRFKALGLQPLSGAYKQSFEYDVNTFPGKMAVSINGNALVPGKDFIVGEESHGTCAKGKLVQADSVTFIDRDKKIIVQLKDKLTWSVAGEAADYTLIKVDRKSLTSKPKKVSVDIENKFVKDFKAHNIFGFVKGTAEPDSFIFITAHYDHLGGMGADTYFPGANDNASGVALLLSLAKYYAENPAKYSIGFILFAGEEAGLKGSKYFTDNPVIPLKNIRFLMNTDLAGTGVDGITVVNANEYPNEFKMLNEVNDADKLISKINARGKAANSDHYFFSEKGVPAFFFYTMGGISAYHDIFDRAETLPLSKQEDLQKLVVGFNKKLMQ